MCRDMSSIGECVVFVCRDTSSMLVNANSSLVEKQAELLRSYLDTHGLEHDTALQRDMIAR